MVQPHTDDASVLARSGRCVQASGLSAHFACGCEVSPTGVCGYTLALASPKSKPSMAMRVSVSLCRCALGSGTRGKWSNALSLFIQLYLRQLTTVQYGQCKTVQATALGCKLIKAKPKEQGLVHIANP